ncbi:hypothetical protein RB195_002650 [Necator americanus]
MHHCVAFFFVTYFSTCTATTKSSGFFPMSPGEIEEETRESKRTVHPFFLSSNKGAIVDIAVPEEQRLYGRESQAFLESRPVAFGVQNFRKLMNSGNSPTLHGPTESTDTANERSVSDRAAANLTFPSLGYRPPPPPVRRAIDISPRCRFDADKWALHMESTLAYATMFDRKTGESCEECLERCMQRQAGTWTCRSVVYDSTWHICDMFAVAGTAAPFTLVEYQGRDYFEYLAAQPPSDDELSQANDFFRQQQLAEFDKKITERCERKQHDKVSGVKTQEVHSNTYDAIPVKVQLEADEKELEKREKERGKKERKQLKTVKDSVPTTISLSSTDPVSGILTTEYPIPESKTIATENEMAATTPDEGKEEENTSSPTEVTESSTAVIETTAVTLKSIRRKPAKKENKKASREKQKEFWSISWERGEIPVEREQRSELEALRSGQIQGRKLKKIIRKKPFKDVKTNSTLATTTEVIQELSQDVAREKIQLYQQRKAAEVEQMTTSPKKRRVRIQRRRLYGDLEEGTKVDGGRRQSRRRGSSDSDGDQYTLKNVEVSENQIDETKEVEKIDEKKPTKKGVSHRKIQIAEEPSVLSNPPMNPPTTHPNTTRNAETAAEILRTALAKEIRKFISKELDHKMRDTLHRVHGTRLFEESEEMKTGSELVPMTSKHKSHKERVFPTNICEEHEKLVMMTFAESTRKPYTTAIEMVKVRDQQHCLDLCKQSLDCSSAVFSSSSSFCEMSATRARHTIPDIRPSLNETYIEKACVDSEIIRGRATNIVGVANHILAGFVEQVEDAYGVEQCIAACYMALKQYGFHCMSAMWYPMDKHQNCLLNSESRRTQPKLFIAEDTGHQMIYFEHPDAPLYKRMHDDTSGEKSPTTDDVWTAWSLCNGKEERVRYSRCKEHIDIRKCLKETAKCEKAAVIPS